jgi:hypothetical protein
MAEPQFSTHPDDDLPRTIRRERDARQQRSAAPSAQQSYGSQSNNIGGAAADQAPGDGPPVTVTALDVPFFRLMAFFIKAVFAAIPALILLGLILFAIGQVAQILVPWLVKAKILITFG